MRAVGMLLRGQLRQHGKSWLALAMLAALVGGLVMAAVVTAWATTAQVSLSACFLASPAR